MNGTEAVGIELDNLINSHQKVIGDSVIHKRLSAVNSFITLT